MPVPFFSGIQRHPPIPCSGLAILARAIPPKVSILWPKNFFERYRCRAKNPMPTNDTEGTAAQCGAQEAGDRWEDRPGNPAPLLPGGGGKPQMFSSSKTVCARLTDCHGERYGRKCHISSPVFASPYSMDPALFSVFFQLHLPRPSLKFGQNYQGGFNFAGHKFSQMLMCERLFPHIWICEN